MVQEPRSDAERKERHIDLSLPQVAGSAVAAIAAAVMASQLGVYGTIAGAGVMSVVATCGGSVFQHFFRRTGEQIREVTVQVKHPADRQVPVRTRETDPAPHRPEGDATRVLRRAGPGDVDRTTMLRQVLPGEASPGDAYSDARTHGTRVRGWKRSALAATGVFVLSMAGITGYEMVSGHGLGGNGGNGGTTVGSVVRGERDAGTTSPEPSAGTAGTGQEGNGDNGPRQDGGDAPTPGRDSGDGQSAQPGTTDGDGSTPGPAPTPSASGGVTTPEPTSPTTPGDAATSAAPHATATGEAPAQGGGEAGTDADR
jgi:hypothetical protein